MVGESASIHAYRTFVDVKISEATVHGEWFGYCHRDGTVARSSKGGNYKGFFHVPRALLVAIQGAEAIK